MAIDERQLETWSHLGSKAQSADTYAAIRGVLTDPAAPFASRSFDVFLQGSYGNDTNIHADSDVDVVIRLTSTYYEDATALSASDMARRDADWVPAHYGVTEFKSEVAAWLARNYGPTVDPGGKAILVPAGGGRRNADVLACAEFRYHHSYAVAHSSDFWSGICFWPPNGNRIVNYPKQHAANLTTKHQATAGRLKPVVRIFKNMRNAMIRDGLLGPDVAPSYFLEGMLTNVPNQLFGYSHQTSVANALDWLRGADRTRLTCANGIHWLLRDGHPVCWREASFEAFLTAAERRWITY